MTTAKKLVSISRRLSRKAESCVFSGPVEYVYNPLSYAKIPHEEYLRAWGNPGIECLLLGMNPGPWGMAQTGVPFGEVAAVRDFLRISGNDHAYADDREPAFTLYADGLQEPLGLAVHPDDYAQWQTAIQSGEAYTGNVWTVQRGELTRMKDEDGDLRGDVFETVCDDWSISGNYHEYS